MSKYIILIIFIITTASSFAQKLSGAWRIGYFRSIEKLYSVDDLSDSTDTYEAFNLGNGIFEFDNNKVRIYNFIDKPKKGTLKNGNTIKSQGKEMIIESFNQDSVVLKLKENKENYIVLYPFKSNDIKFDKSIFANSLWEVQSNLSNLSTIQFHFSDSSSLVCNYHGEKYGYANFGEWRIYQSGKYYILYVSDRINMDEYVFYCSSNSNDEITAIISEQYFLNYPAVNEVKLVKRPLPTKSQIAEKEKMLLGKWVFQQFYNPIDSLSLLDSLISLDYTIQFMNNGEYELFNGIKSIVRESEVDFSENLSGKWKVSNSGNYIIVDPENRWQEYFSIYSVDMNSLVLDLKYRYDEHATFSTRMKLKRND
jgi:hypothetical protein